MRGGVHGWTDPEQALRERVAALRAEFAFRQRIERMRWEKDVLAPASEAVRQEILEGKLPTLELPSAA